MFFYKKPEAVCKHLVFSDTVLYNNKVCQKDGKLNAEKRDDAARERAVPDVYKRQVSIRSVIRRTPLGRTRFTYIAEVFLFSQNSEIRGYDRVSYPLASIILT